MDVLEPMPITNINNDLLISAPILQNYLVDGQGNPLANGTITFFQDSARTILKNVYFQSSNTGGYQYQTLPNPLTVSGAGLICDATGSPTNPFYYPYSETDNTTPQAYYITIVDQNGLPVNTLQNFPFNPNGSGTPSGVVIANNQNLIGNNSFWRNVGTMDLTNVTNTVVAPSYHDGYVFNGSASALYGMLGAQTIPAGGEIMFSKNNTGATDKVTFNTFGLGLTPAITGDAVPEFYLSHNCSASTTGELFKIYQFPITLHTKNLANMPFTVTMQGQSLSTGDATSSQIQFGLYQYAGTNGTGSNVTFINGLTPIPLTTTWQKVTASGTFPSANGLTLGAGGDDAFFLLICLPTDTTCSINFTVPSLYLAPENEIPTNTFSNYDTVNSYISSPITCDIRVSLSNYPSPSNFGWCPMNNGVIGNYVLANAANPYFARQAQDTWPLFNLLWQHFKPYEVAAQPNPVCQMFSVAPTTVTRVNYSGSAYTDFANGNAIQLTAAMGQVLMGTVPLSSLLPAQVATTNTGKGYSSVVTPTNSGGCLWTTAGANELNIFQGAPVIFINVGGSLPTLIKPNTIYYAIPKSATTFLVALSFTDAMAGTAIAYSGSPSATTTVYFGAAGMHEGEYAHMQLAAELPPHTHTIWQTSGTGTATPGASQSFQTPAALGAASGNGPGTSALLNVTQPSLMTNFYIKL